MAYTERTLTCAECGLEFIFTVEDQEFHAGKGYQEPKRCPNCRQARRADRGGGGSRGGGPRELFDIVCDNCGQSAQVPFQPSQDRPVYCNDCFSKQKPARPTTSSW